SVLHDEEKMPFRSRAEIVDGDDIRMLQSCQGTRLTLEPRRVFLIGTHFERQQLNRYQPTERRLPCLVDCTHSAPSKQRLDLIPRKQWSQFNDTRWNPICGA